MITRRLALVGTTALTLAACTAPGGTTPAAIVSDAQAIAQGLLGALTQVPVGLIPPATLAVLQNDLSLAEGAATALSTNLPGASAATTVQKIDAWINAVFNTLAAPPLNGLIPAPFNLAVSAATILLPELEAFVNQFIAAPAAAPLAAAALRAKMTPAGMTHDQAVSALQAAQSAP